jgi:cytoplasmic iron level regulating protein YaaA (DUF328/UPF0246 family)
MAEIDVSELLTDPDFVDVMTLVTRFPLTTTLGENIMTEQTFESVGSVQPADYRTLQRIPEALRNENISSFWFKGKIISTEDGKYSSIIVFKGQRYQVLKVADWSNWGQGYCEGICVAEKPS